jgi:hypothetical protein
MIGGRINVHGESSPRHMAAVADEYRAAGFGIVERSSCGSGVD